MATWSSNYDPIIEAMIWQEGLLLPPSSLFSEAGSSTKKASLC
jgi:hypothetical protein